MKAIRLTPTVQRSGLPQVGPQTADGTMALECTPPRPVYVVDDDGAFRRAVERLLRSAGVTAVSFESASAFLKAAPALVDGCVLLDVRMPGMGGLELQQQLKSLGFKLPIIGID